MSRDLIKAGSLITAIKNTMESNLYPAWTTRMLLLCAICKSSAQPLVHPSQVACYANPQIMDLPFCNPSLPIGSRISDLLSRLTTGEKISLMGQDEHGNDAAVHRLGLPSLPFGEALHGAVAGCVSQVGAGEKLCPTSFPHALALAASFNRTLWHAVGDAISTEARSLNNMNASSGILGASKTFGLLLWTPNLNPYRDPRWGRGHETPGEDPFLSGAYGTEYIAGLQGGDGSGFLKVAAIVKHAFDYDLEGNYGTKRQAFNAVVSDEDQRNYFWPPFRAIAPVASGLMCSCT